MIDCKRIGEDMAMKAVLEYQKSELIDGVVYDMSPANTKHINIQNNLITIIRQYQPKG